jgi:hypothetical protein
VGLGPLEVVGLEVAEHLISGAEDRVVADAGGLQRREHLGPHLAMSANVVVDPVGLDAQHEPASLGHLVAASSASLTHPSRDCESAFEFS